MKDDRFEILFKKGEKEKLKRLAKNKHKTMAFVIRELINLADQNPQILNTKTGQ